MWFSVTFLIGNSRLSIGFNRWPTVISTTVYKITSNENKGKHHEDYSEFQKTFFSDTQKLFFCFNEIRNPFEENRLVVLDTGDVLNSDVETCLANLLERNKERDKESYKHSPVICDIPITDTIKTY